MDDPPAVDPIAELITTWNELNSGVIEELEAEPSPLEFMRYVARNTPFVVRRGAADWPATRRWNAAYLRRALGRHPVNVAVTPFGNADAPTPLATTTTTTKSEKKEKKKSNDDDDDELELDLVFAKPHEEDQPFEDFLTFLQRQELDPTFREGDGEVRYAQTRMYAPTTRICIYLFPSFAPPPLDPITPFPTVSFPFCTKKERPPTPSSELRIYHSPHAQRYATPLN